MNFLNAPRTKKRWSIWFRLWY